MSQSSPERVDAAVSYSRADQAIVEPILAGLRGRGLAVWFDKDIPGGALWEEIIARKYRASGALLFFLSKSSLASQRCSEEVSTARTLGKPIIPVLIEPLRLPDDLPDRFVLTLQARNTVDAFDRPHEEAESAILAALQGFGIVPGEPMPQTVAPAAAAPRPAAARPAAQAPALPSRSNSVKWIAFGGVALAVLLVGAGYVMFGMKGATPADSTTVAATTPASVASRPAAPADPVNPPASAPEPAAPVPAAPTPDRAVPAPVEASSAKVTPQQASYQVGYPLLITIEGLPGGERDYVALAQAGAPASSTVFYEYTQGARAKELKLRPVMLPGQYELRLFFQADAEAGRTDLIRASVPVTITPAGEVTLTLDQDEYAEAEPLMVTYAGLPGNAKDWIAVAETTSPDSSYISYVYTQGQTSGTAQLRSLMKPGRYEIRAYFDDSTGDRIVRGRAIFQVVAAPEPQMELDAETYAPGDTITVTYSDMPSNDRDWFSLAAAGSRPDQYLSYSYTGGEAAGTVELKAPEEPGAYEVRAYFDDSSGDKTIRASAEFTVEAAE